MTGYRCLSSYEDAMERRMKAQIRLRTQSIEAIEHRMDPNRAPRDVGRMAPVWRSVQRVLWDPNSQSVLRLALINGLGGVQLWVPKGPCNHPGGARTWTYLANVPPLWLLQATRWHCKVN